MVDKSLWVEMTERDPNHSNWYIERFRTMAANGADLDGEARCIDAMAARGSAILDAGCGPGRVGGALHHLGHQVVGVDVDPVLIAAAEADHPGPRWLVGDLAELNVADPATGGEMEFDLIVCAGNVMTFVAPTTRRDVLAGFRRHLAAGGRAVIGFGMGRGYEVDDFRDDAATAGLRVALELGTWDLRPFGPESDFIVAILDPA